MVELTKILYKLDSMAKPTQRSTSIKFQFLGLNKISHNILSILTRSEGFSLIFEDLNLNLKPEVDKKNLPPSNSEDKFFISFESDESSESGMSLLLTDDQEKRLLEILFENELPFLNVKLNKIFEADEQNTGLPKVKQRKNEETPIISFESKLDLSSMKIPGNILVNQNIEFSPETLKEEYKSLFASEQSFFLQIQILCDSSLIQEYSLNSTISKISPLQNGIQKSKIRDTMSDLIKKMKNIIPTLISDYLSSFEQKTSTKDDFKKLNAFTEQQKINLIYSRKMSYLANFFNSKKSLILQQKIKLLCERLFFDKIMKEGAVKSSDEFLEANLGKLLLEIEVFTNNAIKTYFLIKSEGLPFELKFFNEHQIRQKLAVETFHSETDEDFYRKIKEYEKIGFWHSSEKFMKQRLIKNPDDSICWYNLTVFYLRKQQYDLAESAFDKYSSLETLDKNKTILKVCFMLQRKRFKQAEIIVGEMLKIDRSGVIENLMMSYILEFGYARHKVGAKYFRIARRKQWKILGDNKTQSLSSDRGNTTAKILIKEEECNEETWKELIMVLLKNYFIDLVNLLIHKIERKTSLKNFILANVEIIAKDYSKSNTYFDGLMKNLEESNELSQQYFDIVLTKACNCFFLDHLYEAEELFLKYLKNGCPKSNLYDILLVLGQTYLNRYSYEEACQIFEKLTVMQPKSVPAWLGLCQALLNLEQYSQAEAALFSLSKLEHLESDVLCLLFLVFLKKSVGKEINMESLNSSWAIIKEREIENGYLLFQIIQELKQLELINIYEECLEKVGACLAVNSHLFINRPSQLAKFINNSEDI
jgi:tetratricopeptide (TPR) repeat protein